MSPHREQPIRYDATSSRYIDLLHSPDIASIRAECVRECMAIVERVAGYWHDPVYTSVMCDQIRAELLDGGESPEGLTDD